MCESADILALRAEMEAFAQEQKACELRIRELLAAEDPAAGVFHAKEIFETTQNKLRLGVEMEFKRKKINRIKLGLTEENMYPTQEGSLF